MKLVRKNLSELFRSNRRFAVMIILTQILGTFSVFFAAGVLYNNQYVVLEDKTSTLKINIEFNGNDTGQFPSCDDVQEYLSDIYTLMEGALGYVDFLTTYVNEAGTIVSIAASGKWSDGTYLPDDTIEQTLYYQIYEGRNLNAEDYSEKRLAALATSNYTASTVELYGREYSVVGHRQEVLLKTDPVVFYISPTTWQDIPLDNVQLNLLRLPTKQEYRQICDILDRGYKGQYTISDYYAGDADFKALYLSLGIALAGIMLVAIWTLVMLYNFIYEKRRRKMTIYALCGCSRGGNMKICLTEVICLSLPACTVGAIFFIANCKLWMEEMYPYIPLLFTGRVILGLLLLIVLLFIAENGVLAWIRSGASIRTRMREE